MSEAQEIIEKAADIQKTMAEGELRKAAVDALKRNGLPEDLIERTKTLPGSAFEHAATFANLPDADRANLRKAFKDLADFPVRDFDRLTAPAGGNGNGRQGRPVEWNDPDPWPEPVYGAELLDTIKAKLEQYAAMPEGGAEAAALWALYTWVFRAFATSPYLMVTAPEREAGKTRVTELLTWMVRRAKPVSDASAAAIIRGIENDGPTLIFDEAQHFLKRRPEDPIRGILLAGFTKRFATVERCEGDAHEVRVFSTFAPKAMNGRKLAGLDDMLTSRSVVIPMTRATMELPELRADRDPVGEDLRRQCARWAANNAATLREADPDTGGRIGRIAQVWRPLFAIADAAGGDWPVQARKAADALSAVAGTFADGETPGTMLLADVREVFRDRADPERILSRVLDKALIALPERPWSSMPTTGKAITPQARGRMLADYGIRAKTLRSPDGRGKGYERGEFEPAWAAYLPGDMEDLNRDTVTTLENKALPRLLNRDNGSGCHGSEIAGNAAKQRNVTVSRLECTGEREREPESAPAPASLPSQPPGTDRAADAYRKASRGD